MSFRKTSTGSVLVIGLFLVVIAATYGVTTMARALAEQNLAQRNFRLASAFSLAEAGVDRGLRALTSNPSWSGASYTPLVSGGYDVTVEVMSSTRRRLTSTGHYPSNDASAFGYQQKRIEVVVSVPSSAFDYATFAATRILLDSHATIDSYDASIGAYGVNGNVGADGSIGSNATAKGTITLDSNASVHGNAAVGPGGNVTTAIVLNGSNAEITGSLSALSQAKDLMPKTFEYVTTTSTTTLTDSQSLPAGTYHYAYVDLDSNSEVQVNGDVTLYVDQYFKLDSNVKFSTTCDSCKITMYVKGTSTRGPAFELNSNSELSACNQCTIDISINGTIAPGTNPPLAVRMDSNTTSASGLKPAQFNLVVATTDPSASTTRAVEIASNSSMVGTLQAPGSSIELKSGAVVYGAIVGQSIALDSNAKVHYDASLGSGSSGSGSVRILSWREL